ncbi:hypothetical protein [Novosphingobium sp. BL-52-GroH]|uniref:hypothetical protein n=1 Tax=Novosphingobium sp. BL-52-GroH TaxID=3349877 RepID=UPI003850D238
MDDQYLSRTIAIAVGGLEEEGELVVTSSSVEPIANKLAEAVLSVVPHTSLSLEELVGVRCLILHAISDKKFFDWEVPTLTGFTAEEFKLIAEKLPID